MTMQTGPRHPRVTWSGARVWARAGRSGWCGLRPGLGPGTGRPAVGLEGRGALEEALARWVGTALEEFAHEGWAAGEVARLTELHASATEDLAAALIAASRWRDAVALLEAHVRTHPLRDRPRGLL